MSNIFSQIKDSIEIAKKYQHSIVRVYQPSIHIYQLRENILYIYVHTVGYCQCWINSIHTPLCSNTIGTMLSYIVTLLNASPSPRVRFDLRIINTSDDLKTLTRAREPASLVVEQCVISPISRWAKIFYLITRANISTMYFNLFIFS